MTATVSSGSTRPSRVSVMRPARPAVPVWSASMPRSGRARRLAASMVRLVDDDAATAGQQHGPHDGQPVVGLVVEDAVGEADAAPSPRATCRRSGGPRSRAARSPRHRGATASPAATPSRSRTRAWARASGKPPCVWTVSMRGRRSMSPSGEGVLEGQRLGRGEGAAAHVDDEAVEGGGVVRQLVDELPAERGAALDGVAVEVALDGEGHGAGRDGRQQAVVGGVAGLAGLALADLDLRLQAAQALQDRGFRAGRHEDEQAAPRGARHDGGRQRGVAAAGDGQRGAPGPPARGPPPRAGRA